jgi:translation initiation factor IF-2
MEETAKTYRLSKVASEMNVGINTIYDFLIKKGFKLEKMTPNTKITGEMYDVLAREYQSEKQIKESTRNLTIGVKHDSVSAETSREKERRQEAEAEEELIIKSGSIGKNIAEKPSKESMPAVTPEPGKKESAKKEEETSPKTTEEVVAEEKKEEEKTAPKKKTATKKTADSEVEKETIETEEKETAALENEKEVVAATEEDTQSKGLKILGKIDLKQVETKSRSSKKSKTKSTESTDKEETKKEETIEAPATEIPVAEPQTADVIVTEEVVEETPEVKESPVETKEEKTEAAPPAKPDENFMPTEFQKLEGPKILGKIELPVAKEYGRKPVASSSDDKLLSKKKKRKRIRKEAEPVAAPPAGAKPDDKKGKGVRKGRKEQARPEVSTEEIDKQIKETLARLSAPTKSKASKYRRLKRDQIHQQLEEEQQKMEEEKSILRVTEFLTANELATMMSVPVTDIISTCLTLGLFVSINQRLDAETIVIVAEEFGYKVEFVTVDMQEGIVESEDKPEDLSDRHPIVTVMGHVDHGKTSLLDYIRSSNVIAGEAGGITQHIGAYEVTLDSGKKITFLDTPGHEAFTAMRARGAKVTDVAIIVISADDSVMPQTIEAINHAQAARVPIVFAINKIDKPGANPEKIREELSKMNILVEDWGGKYQCQEISAKKGLNIELLLDKVLLEAEMLELKANSKKPAKGFVLESSLEKGRGYVSKLLVQNGSMRIGDMVLAGCHFGRVKAMYNERNIAVSEAGPATPVLMLGLNGAPQAGDAFNVMIDEHEAKEIATKRLQLQREQGIRTQKHITLDEIGRRIAIGDFKELNIIIKGDVDGSVEALSDALLKLSNVEVQVNVIHKSVGQITESDVLLASASNAVIIGFQVRPSLAARKLAENEQIDIRLYSIIYTAINELKSAIEGMLSPEIEEKITCNLEVRDVFKINKVGSVAGCLVLDGRINRNSRIRLIRNGIVVYTGTLSSLKRYKDDAREVQSGMECGLSIENFNDMKVGDIIEGFEQVEVKRKL